MEAFQEILLVGKLHGGRCVVQRSEQVLFHVTDRAAVLCKALQHKANMVGVQLHKPAAYHLGGLIVPGNAQRLAVGGTGIHKQVYDLVDGVLIVRVKPEKKVYTRPFLSNHSFLTERLMRSSRMPYRVLASVDRS